MAYHGLPLTSDNRIPRFATLVPDRIFVGGIPHETSVEDLTAFFNNFGAVKDGRIVSDRQGISKGYGFVTFKCLEDAKKILQENSHVTMNQHKMCIGPAYHKTRSTDVFDYAKQLQEDTVRALSASNYYTGVQMMTPYPGSFAVPSSPTLNQPCMPQYQVPTANNANQPIYLTYPQANVGGGSLLYPSMVNQVMSPTAAPSTALYPTPTNMPIPQWGAPPQQNGGGAVTDKLAIEAPVPEQPLETSSPAKVGAAPTFPANMNTGAAAGVANAPFEQTCYYMDHSTGYFVPAISGNGAPSAFMQPNAAAAAAGSPMSGLSFPYGGASGGISYYSVPQQQQNLAARKTEAPALQQSPAVYMTANRPPLMNNSGNGGSTTGNNCHRAMATLISARGDNE